MRGHPIFRFLLTLLLLAFLGFAVWRLTARETVIPPTPAPAAVEKTNALANAEIILTASLPWEKCHVHLLGNLLLDAKTENNAKAQTIRLPLDKSADLVIDATWKDSANHALRIQVLKNQNPVFETTLWGNQTLQEAVTIP
ncbi:MAG: hypothetical protein ABI615_02350 [Chthoniobacterales bacterium]